MDKDKVALTDRSKLLPTSLAIVAADDELAAIGWKLAHIKDLIEQGMTIEGSRHKQYYFAQIAKSLNFDISAIKDQGIAP